MTPDQLITEARAKIIWGESSGSVRDFLLAKGIPAPVADATIAEALAERNAEIRRIGVRNILTGVVLTAAGGGVLGWILHQTFPNSGPSGARVYGWGGRGIICGSVILGLTIVYGLGRLLRGIIYCIRPQSEHKSIPDIEE